MASSTRCIFKRYIPKNYIPKANNQISKEVFPREYLYYKYLSWHYKQLALHYDKVSKASMDEFFFENSDKCRTRRGITYINKYIINNPDFAAKVKSLLADIGHDEITEDIQ